MKSMKFRRPTSRLRRALAVAAIATLATGTTVALTATPAAASTGSLNDASLTVSNSAANAPAGSSAPLDSLNVATYTWAFTTVTTPSPKLDHVTLTMPYTTTLSASSTPVLTVYGLAASSCSPSIGTLTAGTAGSPDVPASLTVSLGCTVATPASTPVAISITNIVNPTKPVSDFGSTVTTYDSTPTELATGTVGTAPNTSSTIDFTDNTTPVTVFVPSSLSFTNEGAQSITLAPIPGGPIVSAPAVSLGVTTNEPGGYTLSACVQGGIVNGADNNAKIAQGAPTIGTTAFGATASGSAGLLAVGGSAGSWTTAPTAFSGGYAVDCTSRTTVAVNSHTTAGDSINIVNSASASSTQEGGTYTGTITYVVTPTY